jgi:hypothetical protein
MKSAGRLKVQNTAIEGGKSTRYKVWRVIPNHLHYVLNSDTENLQVWSLPRGVPGKGGSTRQLAGRMLTPNQGRVKLDGQLYRIEKLYPLVWPDLINPKPLDGCRNGHSFIGLNIDRSTNIAHWGDNRNRICLQCHPDLPEFERRSYHAHWGMGKQPPEWPVRQVKGYPKVDGLEETPDEPGEASAHERYEASKFFVGELAQGYTIDGPKCPLDPDTR